ncbi:MAG: TolC family protein [Planctomycetes bacterium]|nr:TolC family protein [Planctomycetota bacterium]
MYQSEIFKLLTILLLIQIISISGCSKDVAQYKEEADKEVYQIIDSQWKDDFGPKSDYKISDVAQSANDVAERIDLKDVVSESGILTIEGAVRLAYANNREYQSQREVLYSKALDLTLAAYRFAPLYFSNSAVGYSIDDRDEVIAAASGIGFNRIFKSGVQFSTEIALAWTEVLTGDIKSGLASVFAAVIRKPLLRDSQRKLLLENLTQAQRDSLYQIRQFSRFRKELTVSVITAYYNALLSYDKLNNARQYHQGLNETYKLMEKMARVGRLEKHELEQAQQDILESRDIFTRQKNLCKQALDELKMILSIPPTKEIFIDTERLAVIAAGQLPTPAFTEQQAVDQALNIRLDLLNASDRIADAKRKIDVVAEAFKVGLDLTASSASFADVRTSPLGVNVAPINSLGLELDLPLDRKAERNQYRKALIALEQAKRNNLQSQDAVTLEIRTAFRNLTKAASVRDIQLKSLDLAANRLKNTSMLLQYTRSSTRDVLDAQEDLFKAKNDAAEALVEFTTSTLNFYRDAGVMKIKEGGMWKIKQHVNKIKTKKIPAINRDSRGPEDIISDWMKKRKRSQVRVGIP